jgi:hypothetical protein
MEFGTNGGSERMRIDSSGNVGIGVTPSAWRTTNPALQIGQAGNLFGYSSSVITGIGSNAFINSAGDEKYIVTGTATLYQQNNAGTHRWFTAASGTAGDTITFSERMRIDSSGNLLLGTTEGGSDFTQMRIVGLNTDTDFTNLTAQRYLGGAASLGIENSSSTTGTFASIQLAPRASSGNIQNFAILAQSTSDTFGSSLIFANRTASAVMTERMRIDSSGNVLVGATSAVNSSKLLIAGVSGSSPVIQGASGAGAYLHFYNNAQTTGSFQIGQGAATGSDNIGYIYNNSNAATVFGTNGTERMRIDSSGNLLVGRTTASGDLLDVFNGSSSSSVMRLRNDLGGGQVFARFDYGGSVIGSITGNNSATAYNTSSDYRLKENIAPMTGALAIVSQLKPVTYDWKSGGSSQGFIAHELAEVVPDCVTGEKDAVNEDGSIKAQGIDTSFLVATLTAAIQEQQTLINNLTTRLNALEGK